MQQYSEFQCLKDGRIQREVHWVRTHPPGQSQVAIGFLIHSDMDTLETQLDPGSNCFSREVSTAIMSKKGPITVRIVWRSANVKPISAKSEQ